MVSFQEVEAWLLLFALEESSVGSARVVYDSWFGGLVHRLAVRAAPIEWKLRNLIVARMPLSMSFNHDSASTHRREMDRLFTTEMSEVAKHESFCLACDCLRVGHDVRDALRG